MTGPGCISCSESVLIGDCLEGHATSTGLLEDALGRGDPREGLGVVVVRVEVVLNHGVRQTFCRQQQRLRVRDPSVRGGVRANDLLQKLWLTFIHHKRRRRRAHTP